MSKSGTNSLKNKTWETIYGKTKATELKRYKRKLFKNKSFIDRYGKKKASIIINKIKNKLKGRKLNNVQIKAIINSNKIRQLTKKTKLKMSKSHLGYIWSDKSRAKARLSHLGKKNHFFGKKHTPETIRKIKASRIYINMPKKNSSIEVKVQKKLKDKNIKFKKHVYLIGRPDIFIEPNICIFCDGDYWHGNPLLYKPNDIINAGKRKIKVKNKWKYDKNITSVLLKKGYKVLRFWETDINTNIDNVVNRILVFK